MVQRVEILDSLRAFAALTVCLYHFVYTITDFIKTEYIRKVFEYGYAGVNTFFVISGFIIPWAMHNAGYSFKDFFSFFLKRISRLEPPYIISIALAIVIFYVREKYFGRTNDIVISGKQIMLHFGYLIPFFKDYQWLNSVYWTLAIEFQYYLLIALVFIPLIKSNLILRCCFYAIFIAASFLTGYEFLPLWLPVFLLGILLFLIKTNKISKTEYYIATLVTIGFCIFKYAFAVTFFSVIPVLFILYYPDLKIFGLHFLGKFSYSTYLIHPLLGSTLINVLSHHCTTPIARLCVILLGITLTLVGAWIMYLVIERPSKNFSAAIKYKKTE